MLAWDKLNAINEDIQNPSQKLGFFVWIQNLNYES